VSVENCWLIGTQQSFFFNRIEQTTQRVSLHPRAICVDFDVLFFVVEMFFVCFPTEPAHKWQSGAVRRGVVYQFGENHTKS